MPTILFKSNTRIVSENCTLTLVVRHRLLAGEPSDTVHNLNSSPPQCIDILLDSPLMITISGSLNGTRVTQEKLQTSRIAQHLVEHLRVNADALGIDAVADPRISEDTGLLTLSCTGSRPYAPANGNLPHLKLVAFDMDYVWQEASLVQSSQGPLASPESAMNPFSRQLSLPYMTAIDNVVARFLTFQVVKRYPLIFGPWCKQLALERTFLPSIFGSIQNILKRTQNAPFQKLCKKQMKIYKFGIGASLASADNALSDYTGRPSLNVKLEADQDLIFKLAMERIYISGLKQPRFKGFKSVQIAVDRDEDDMLENSQVCRLGSQIFEEELHHNASSDQEDELDQQSYRPHRPVSCVQEERVAHPILKLEHPRNHPGHSSAEDFSSEACLLDALACDSEPPDLYLSPTTDNEGIFSDLADAVSDSSGDIELFDGSAVHRVMCEADLSLDYYFDETGLGASADSDDPLSPCDDDFLESFHEPWSPDIQTYRENLDDRPIESALVRDDEDFLDIEPHNAPHFPLASSPVSFDTGFSKFCPESLATSYHHGVSDDLDPEGLTRANIDLHSASQLGGCIYATGSNTAGKDGHGASALNALPSMEFPSLLLSAKEAPSNMVLVPQEMDLVLQDTSRADGDATVACYFRFSDFTTSSSFSEPAAADGRDITFLAMDFD